MATQDPQAWQDGLQVVSVPDEQILSQHSFAALAQSLIQTATGRTKHLRSEIQWLENGLPRNIFVRYGESRMDVMKIVIAGPVGSPYEHGLFEFDLLCPAEYPREPPKMFFRTTGGGSVYFNPNLYHNGYVCLSLINTWNGDQWQSGTSTLLQVFVSIQAMVFCEEPWCNEPGREGLQGTEASLQFNHSLYKSVVKYGMLEWIECKKTPPPPAKSSRWSDMPPGIPGAYPAATRPNSSNEAKGSSKHDVFADIAQSYFDANREGIISTVKRWIKEVDEAKVLAEKKMQDHLKNMPPPPPLPAGIDTSNYAPPPPGFPTGYDPSSYIPHAHHSLHVWGSTSNTKSTASSSSKPAVHFYSVDSKKAPLPPSGKGSGTANANLPPPSSSKGGVGKGYNHWLWQTIGPTHPPPPPSFTDPADGYGYWLPPLPPMQPTKGQPPPPPSPPDDDALYAPVSIDDAVADWFTDIEKKKKEKPGKVVSGLWDNKEEYIKSKDSSPEVDAQSDEFQPAKVSDWVPAAPSFASEPPAKPPAPKHRYFTRSVADRLPQPKKIELVPEGATLLQYLKAALTDLGGMENPRRRIEV